MEPNCGSSVNQRTQTPKPQGALCSWFYSATYTSKRIACIGCCCILLTIASKQELWGVRWKWKEAFTVYRILCTQCRKLSLQLPISRPLPWGRILSLPPLVPYLSLLPYLFHLHSPIESHHCCCGDTCRLGAARQWWQITQALPETLRQ